MTAKRLGFVRWRSPGASGGNRYDDELGRALSDLGVDLRAYPIEGTWPLPEPAEFGALSRILDAERAWLLPNIVASAASTAVLAALDAGRHITLLLHYFPADDAGLPEATRDRLGRAEGELVCAASSVVVTSQWAADEVRRRYGRGDAVVALPGVDRADLAAGCASGGGPPTLLWLGRISPAKDPLTFVAALTQIADLDFRARMVGPGDAAFVGQVRRAITQNGLADDVRITGPRNGAELEAIWAETDLLVHSSRFETYGMVVAEALAHGIASIVATGSGAVEAQRGVGASFPPGDAAALATQLRDWLTDPDLRRRWREDALAAREQLPSWVDAARTVATALGY